jgi:hypothetical protein
LHYVTHKLKAPFVALQPTSIGFSCLFSGVVALSLAR